MRAAATDEPAAGCLVRRARGHAPSTGVRSLVADVLGRADALTRGEAQVADLDSKRRKSGRHTFHGRHSRRGSERHSHQCPDRNAQAQPPERTGWRDGLECDGAEGGRRHEPDGEHSSRAHELRAGHGNHGGHEPSRGSGKPHRDHRSASIGSQSPSTTRPSTLVIATRTLNATIRSRAKSQRRQRRASATIASARTSATRSAVRQSEEAHPNTATSAPATLSSSSEADFAITAANTATNAADAKSTTSIGRRFLRPGSGNEKTEMPG